MNFREIRTTLLPWRWPIATAAVLLAAGGYWLLSMLLGPAVTAFAVARNELVRTVVASGRVESPSRIDIGAQITGQVTSVPVAEGQSASIGERLITLADRDEKAAVAQARAAVNQAEARLRQIRELARPVAEQTLAQAEANLSNVSYRWRNC